MELDPTFAVAYATLSSIYSNLDQTERAAQYGRKAYELREKVSDLESLGIETNYYENTTRELEKAAQTLDLWYQTYPRHFASARILRTFLSLLAITKGHCGSVSRRQ